MGFLNVDLIDSETCDVSMFSRLVLHKTSKDSLTNGDSIAYFWTVMRVLSQESKVCCSRVLSIEQMMTDGRSWHVARKKII